MVSIEPVDQVVQQLQRLVVVDHVVNICMCPCLVNCMKVNFNMFNIY